MSHYSSFVNRIILWFSLLALCAWASPAPAADFAVKTIEPETVIRRLPDLEAETAAIVRKGQLFECRGKEGEWFEVIVPAYNQRPAFIGFIHGSQVERIESATAELYNPRPFSRAKAAPVTSREPSRLTYGFGLGIPFGVMGFAAEFNHASLTGKSDGLANYYTINLGLGYPVVGFGYSFGLRFYPLGRMRDFQPKASLHYGTIALVNWAYLLDGFSAGAGFQWRLSRKLWMDSDLILILRNWANHSPIKISSGFRWHVH